MDALVRVNAKVIVDNTGAVARVPVLISGAGPVVELAKYFAEHFHCRSPGWMSNVARGLELLLEYTAANRNVFESAQDLFRGFVGAMYSGTVDSSTGLDPSGLYWRPRRPTNANILLGTVADFSDWLCKRGLATSLNPSDLTPGKHQHALAMAAYEHRRSRAFLGHTMPTAQDANVVVRVTPLRTAATVSDDDRPPAFPEDHFFRLLSEGFVRRGFKGHPDPLERMNSRDVLITLLMNGGGVRISECFHLWVHDVQTNPQDPTQAAVRIYHPSEGKAPADWRDHEGRLARNRQDYLKLRYARTPRHLLYGDKEWAGWKHNLLDSNRTRSMAVHWRSPEYGRLFLVFWVRWLRERAMQSPNHPYAFTSTKKGQRGGKQPGSPYTIAAYLGAHQRAVERIGLVPAKANGTTPHGHRHAMGQHLTDLGLSAAAIQKILHHNDLNSQVPYTRPSAGKANDLLNRALSKQKAESSSAHTRPGQAKYPPDPEDGNTSDPRSSLETLEKELQRGGS